MGGIVGGRDGAMFVHGADQTVGLIRMYYDQLIGFAGSPAS